MLRTETEATATALKTETDVEDTPDTQHRSNESGLALNQDCWLTVIDFLFGEFQTLSRLMLVSRSLSRLAVKHIYGQLGHPTNDRMIGNWSFKKLGRLFTLLLYSSGYKFSPKVVQEFLQNHWNLESDSLPIQVYNQPLRFDYFGLSKRMPSDLVHLFVFLMSDSKEENGCTTSTRWMCGVLDHMITVDTKRIEQLLMWTKNLCQLTVLDVMNSPPTTTLNRQKMLELVTHHREMYPGQLTDIFCLRLEPTFTLELMKFIQPTTLCMGEMADSVQVSALDRTGWLKNLKEFKLMFYMEDTIDFEIMYPSLATMHLLDQLLNHSRHLEIIKLWLFDDIYVAGCEDFLSWAPKELAESRIMGRQSSTLAPPSALSLSTPFIPVDLTSLVPVKVFHSSICHGSVFLRAIDGFRYTLQEIVFKGNSTPHQIGVGWTWPLSRLTSLKLVDVTLFMSKLKNCPVLENLYLEDVIPLIEREPGSSVAYWQVPPLIKRLTLIGKITFYSLDLESVGRLDRLEYLSFSYRELHSLSERFKDKAIWNFPRLKVLTLWENANSVWQRRLLESSPNLEVFFSPFDSISFPNSWWYESHEQRNVDETINTKEEKDSAGIKTQARYQAKEIQSEPVKIPNVQATKIRSLWFGGDDWNDDQVKEFTKLLSPSQSTTAPDQEQVLYMETPLTAMDSTKWTTFTDLVVVKLDLDRAWEPDYYNYNAPNIDHLLMVLMTRPKMRLVITLNWLPSKHFIDTHLEKIPEYDCPKVIELFGEYQYGAYLKDDMGDEWCKSKYSLETSADTMDPNKPCLLSCWTDDQETRTFGLKE